MLRSIDYLTVHVLTVPIENVWEYLRGNKLAITVFDDYDDIVDKTCDAWNFFEQDPDRIASITTRT